MNQLEVMPRTEPSFQLLRSQLDNGVRLLPSRLIIPENTEKQAWVALGVELFQFNEDVKWWIGDWALFGELKWGVLRETCELNCLKYQEIQNCKWIAGSIHLSLRRESFAKIKWHHYEVVAKEKPKDQKKFLAMVEEEGLSVSDLRRRVLLSRSDYDALESDGKFVESMTKLWDDFWSYYDRQPDAFWTESVKAIWRDRMRQRFVKEMERLS